MHRGKQMGSHDQAESPFATAPQSGEQPELWEQWIQQVNDLVLICESYPLDPPGPRIVYANEAFCRHTGYRSEELIGATAGILQDPNTSREEILRIGAALKDGQPVSARLLNHTRDGTPIWLEMDISPITNANGWMTHFVAVQRPIGSCVQEQGAPEHSNRALRLLSRCNEALIHAPSEGQLLETVCSLVVELGGYRMAWAGYALYDADRTISPVTCAGHDPSYLSGRRLSWSARANSGACPAGRALRSGQPVVVHDLSAEACYRALLERAEEYGYAGTIALPLTNETGPFGVLVMYKVDRDPVSTEEQQLLQELADTLAFGITTRRVRSREQRLQRMVMRITRKTAAETHKAVLQQLIENLTEAVDADAGFISRLGLTSSHDITVVAGTPADQFTPGKAYALAGTHCERALLEGNSVIASGLADHVSDDTATARLGMQAAVTRALMAPDGTTIGVLTVLYGRPLHDAEFIASCLDAFAEQAGAELAAAPPEGAS